MRPRAARYARHVPWEEQHVPAAALPGVAADSLREPLNPISLIDDDFRSHVINEDP
jgi:hypothetical protein